MKHKLTVEISSQDGVKTLQQLALSLGYIQKRGSNKGGGSISQMVEALAQGQLTITKKEPEHEQPDNQTPTRIRKATRADHQ